MFDSLRMKRRSRRSIIGEYRWKTSFNWWAIDGRMALRLRDVNALLAEVIAMMMMMIHLEYRE